MEHEGLQRLNTLFTSGGKKKIYIFSDIGLRASSDRMRRRPLSDIFAVSGLKKGGKKQCHTCLSGAEILIKGTLQIRNEHFRSKNNSTQTLTDCFSLKKHFV